MAKALNHVLFAMMCKELLVGASVAQIVEVTGLHKVTVRKMIHQMRLRDVLVISDYLLSPQQRPVVKAYKFRQSPDEQDAKPVLKASTLERKERKTRNGK